MEYDYQDLVQYQSLSHEKEPAGDKQKTFLCEHCGQIFKEKIGIEYKETVNCSHCNRRVYTARPTINNRFKEYRRWNQRLQGYSYPRYLPRSNNGGEGKP